MYCSHYEYINIHGYAKINVKKIAFGNRENTTDQKMGVSVFFDTLYKQ